MSYDKLMDIDAALSHAMQTCRLHGYDATSVEEFVASMGISRSAVGATQSEKYSVLLAALRRYDEKERTEVMSAVSRDRTPSEIIRALFSGVVSGSLKNTGGCDCFPFIAALDLATFDDDVESIVTHSFAEIESFFRATIRAGQEIGEIDKDIEAGQVAAMLLAALIGLRVVALGRSEQAMLQSIARQAVNLIK